MKEHQIKEQKLKLAIKKEELDYSHEVKSICEKSRLDCSRRAAPAEHNFQPTASIL